MENIHKYDIFEHTISVPGGSLPPNPFLEVEFNAEFQHHNRLVEVTGFYDGEGRFVLRFMPDEPGSWRFLTHSSIPSLDAQAGEFQCIPARQGVHGPVRVAHQYHFSYADGARYVPVGTTCYAWVHQGDELETQTLETLKAGYFNKMRMCIFPKDYTYSKNEPVHFPYETSDGPTKYSWDFYRPDPAFWRHLEHRIAQLGELGIEADLILFHPYDRWGFADMSAEADEFYLHYAIARLSAFRNIWWSLANEYDLMKAKSMTDWDHIFHILQDYDPHQHLRSIHNCHTFYNHSHPWVTHASIQHGDVVRSMEWRSKYRKPVVIDECVYEGDIEEGWGNSTPEEHLRRFWVGFTRGGYVGHGETYYTPDEVLWWSKGGILRGESPARIRFLRQIFESAPGDLTPIDHWANHIVHYEEQYFLHYFDTHQPRRFNTQLPEGAEYRADLIDTWEMTITPVTGTFKGSVQFDMPVKPYMAVRIERVG